MPNQACARAGSSKRHHVPLLEAQKRHPVPKLGAQKRHSVQRHIPSTPKYGSTPPSQVPPPRGGGRAGHTIDYLFILLLIRP